jgi:hypothetical protein
MLLYEYLLREAEQLGLAEREAAARDWLWAQLRGDGFFDDVPEAGAPSWEWGRDDWLSWRANMDALRTLDGAGPRSQYDPAALATATRALEGARVRPCGRPSELYEGRGVRVVLRTRGGADVEQPADFDSYWQAVFLSLLQPGSEFRRPMCHRCGKPLRTSKKLGKPSRAKLCPSCHVAAHRDKNPEAARERWRIDKERERQRLKGGKRKR